MRNFSKNKTITLCSIVIVLLSAIGTLTAQNQGIILAKATGQDCKKCLQIAPGWSCKDTILNVSYKNCDSGLCQKSVNYTYCVPPVEDQFIPKSGYAVPDFDAIRDSLRAELLQEMTVPPSIVNNITNNFNVSQSVNINISNIIEKLAVDTCPTTWSVDPFVSILTGFTTNRVVYGRWNTGLKIGGQVRRDGCKWFQYGRLNFSYWPDSFAESHCGVSCEWQQALDQFGFQASLGAGMKIPTKNLEVYMEANSNAFFPSPSRTIYPVPDQGVYLGTNWTPSEVFSLGVKIGGTQDRVGGFIQLGIFPTRIKKNPLVRLTIWGGNYSSPNPPQKKKNYEQVPSDFPRYHFFVLKNVYIHSVILIMLFLYPSCLSYIHALQSIFLIAMHADIYHGLPNIF